MYLKNYQRIRRLKGKKKTKTTLGNKEDLQF